MHFKRWCYCYPEVCTWYYKYKKERVFLRPFNPCLLANDSDRCQASQCLLKTALRDISPDPASFVSTDHQQGC
jgi:hypothetical protein